MARFFSFVIFSITAVLGIAQDNTHSEGLNQNQFSQLLKDEMQFTSNSHQEILPNRENPFLTVHKESGTLTQQDGEKVNAIWVYRGTKGKPQGDFDLFAVEAGRAKTFAAANKACSKLIPLGEWRLVNVVHVMAFFSEMVPAHPMFEKPQFKGRFFWSTSLNDKQDKLNKDDFFASNDGGGEPFQVLSYKKFIQWINASSNKAQSDNERMYYKELLSRVEDGIPVICIRGKEPQGR